MYSCFISLKQSSLIPISGLRGYFSVTGNVLIGKSGKRDSGIKFTSPEFAYHLPKPWTDRFAHVNGKQPLFSAVKREQMIFTLMSNNADKISNRHLVY